MRDIEFLSSMYPWIVMLTPSLADISIIVNFKTIMNFMNEIINPPSNSLLATFCELKFETCQKRASSCMEISVFPKRTLSQSFELMFPLSFWSPWRDICCRKRRGESCGRSRGTNWSRQRDQWRLVQMWMWRTKTLLVLLGLTGCGLWAESKDFTLSQIFRRKRLAEKSVSEVSLTPLTFHKMSFQIFNIHH